MSADRLAVLGNGDGIGVDAEDSTGASKFVVDGAKVDLLDSNLAKERGTHDARLNSDIEGALVENAAIHALLRVVLLTVGVQVALAAIFVTFVGRSPFHGRDVRLSISLDDLLGWNVGLERGGLGLTWLGNRH